LIWIKLPKDHRSHISVLHIAPGIGLQLHNRKAAIAAAFLYCGGLDQYVTPNLLVKEF
jgi:hypothetical protein